MTEGVIQAVKSIIAVHERVANIDAQGFGSRKGHSRLGLRAKIPLVFVVQVGEVITKDPATTINAVDFNAVDFSVPVDDTSTTPDVNAKGNCGGRGTSNECVASCTEAGSCRVPGIAVCPVPNGFGSCYPARIFLSYPATDSGRIRL